MTLWKVIAFLEVQPIEKSWKELMVSQASEEALAGSRPRQGVDAEQPGASCRSDIRHGVFAPMPRGARSVALYLNRRLLHLIRF